MAMPGWVPVATFANSMMRINWVFADNYQLDPSIDVESIKSIGPTWGGWRTWRGCATDNVICHDPVKAHELVKRAFQAVCNLYVPKKYYQEIGRPVGIKLYDGDFDHDLDHAEDIIAMHLVSSISDIVILVGFNFAKITPTEDRFENHKRTNYHGMARSVISSNEIVQWVVVDHPEKLDANYENLSNLTVDGLINTIDMLKTM